MSRRNSRGRGPCRSISSLSSLRGELAPKGTWQKCATCGKADMLFGNDLDACRAKGVGVVNAEATFDFCRNAGASTVHLIRRP